MLLDGAQVLGTAFLTAALEQGPGERFDVIGGQVAAGDRLDDRAGLAHAGGPAGDEGVVEVDRVAGFGQLRLGDVVAERLELESGGTGGFDDSR